MEFFQYGCDSCDRATRKYWIKYTIKSFTVHYLTIRSWPVLFIQNQGDLHRITNFNCKI